jgi:hypothetical protein
MKLQQLFEAKKVLKFDKKYTREDNPEIYDGDIVCTDAELSTFDGFPKVLASIKINLSVNKFSNLMRISSI